MTFRAFQINESGGKFKGVWVDLPVDQLPANDVLIRVEYSSINYKDALSSSGNKGVTRIYPHVPGIDAAGTILESASTDWPVGTKVIVTGFDLGMNTWGGFGELIRVPQSWVLALPANITAKMAMSMGTAGLTAALSVDAILQAGITPDRGSIAVSGATGGVGSIAISILAQLGYSVTAISGKADINFMTKTLGASQIIERTTFVDSTSGKVMAKPEFAAAIDTVGGPILAGLIKTTRYGGIVTCCGMVSSPDLNTSIFPFILRGITLAGIDSVALPMSQRKTMWTKLLTDWYPANTAKVTIEIEADQLADKLAQLLAGQAKGRFILRHKTLAGTTV